MTRREQKRKFSYHTRNVQKKVLKDARKKGQLTYKFRPIRIIADFSTETLK